MMIQSNPSRNKRDGSWMVYEISRWGLKQKTYTGSDFITQHFDVRQQEITANAKFGK